MCVNTKSCDVIDMGYEMHDSPTHKIAWGRLRKPMNEGLLVVHYLEFKWNKFSKRMRVYMCMEHDGIPTAHTFMYEEDAPDHDFESYARRMGCKLIYLAAR